MASSGGAAQTRARAAAGDGAGGVDTATAALLERMTAMLTAPAAPGATDVEAARAKASEIFAAFAGEIEGEATEQFDIAVEGATGALPARVYRPKSFEWGRAPIILFFHGGGWSLGALADYDILLRSLAGLSGAIIVSLDYRRAPEHKFPAGLDDARAATCFVARGAEALGGDPRRFAVMGDSAGGNLATVVAREARASGGPLIRVQFLLYPMLDVSRPHTVYPSRMRFGSGDHFLTCAALDASVADYLTDPVNAADPRVSPMNEPDLSGLPPAIIFVGACDPLRDEAAAYADRLSRAGVEAAFHEIAGAVHGFLSFGVLETARRARAALAAEISRTLAEPA